MKVEVRVISLSIRSGIKSYMRDVDFECTHFCHFIVGRELHVSGRKRGNNLRQSSGQKGEICVEGKTRS